MKPLKYDKTFGWTKEAKRFKHGERSMGVRRIMFKKATKRCLKDLDKSEEK